MKRLILVRHAKSSWGEPGLADFDRPLNKRGKRDAPQMGKRLKELGVEPDLIVTSPAKRAVKTARKVADELGYQRDQIQLIDILYGAHPDDTMGVVNQFPEECDTVMLFAHNPTTTEVVNSLTEFSTDNMPTCACFCAAFNVDSWRDATEGTGTFVFYEYPKLLG